MNCDCHCNAKCKLLGGLEHQIMEILWSSESPLKPSEVLTKLSGKHAYTTIMTILKRMTDKKLLKRKLKGNVYLYTPTKDKVTFASPGLEDLYRRFLHSYGDLAVSSFKKVSKELGYKL